MSNGFFQDGSAIVGGKLVAFSKRKVRDRFSMYVPVRFSEDKNLVSNYTYLFSQDKSPLSIAIKYSPITGIADKDRQINLYFSQATETLDCITRQDAGIYYRETVTGSKLLSVYSLRFAVEVEGGLLFGCFNCSAGYKDDWRPVVLEMLQNIEEA